VDEIEPHVGTAVSWRGQTHLLAHAEVVVEGHARTVADPPLDSLVRVIRARAAGDDTIADRARRVTAVVVTSDNGLRRRVPDSASVSEFRGIVP
jgi:hypothetical protein